MVRPSAYPSDSYPGQVYPGQTSPPTSTVYLATTRFRSNLIPNPGLETTVSGWTGFNGSVVSRVADALMPSGFAVKGTCDGASTFPLVSTGNITVSAGQTVTISATVHGSATGQSGYLQFSWRDGSNVELSQTHSATQSILTTADPRSVTVTAPASTASVVVSWVCTGAPPNTFTYQVGKWLLEVGSTVGSWFSGDTINAYWTGTAYASTSTLMVLSSNPNLPVIDVRAWLGANPAVQGVPTSAPSLLTDRARKFTIERGRQYELAQDEAATGTLVLDDNDGKLSNGANGTLPMVSGQVRAAWGGVIYPIWTGYYRSWPEDELDPAQALVNAELTDGFEVLAQSDLRSLVTEEIALVTPTPVYHYPFTEPEGSTTVGNVVDGTSYPVAVLSSFPGGGTNLAPGAAAFLPGETKSGLGAAWATGAVGKASHYQMYGPANADGQPLDLSAPWVVALFVRCTAGSTQVWAAESWQQQVIASITVDANATGTITVTAPVGAGNAAAGWTVTDANLKTSGCFVAYGWDGTTYFVNVYSATPTLGLVSNETNHTTTYVVPPVSYSSWLSWGPSFDLNSVNGAQQGDLSMSHGITWMGSGQVPVYNDGKLSGIATAGLTGLASKTPEVQAARPLAYAGMTLSAGGFDPLNGTDPALLWSMRDQSGSNALDSARTVAGDGLGRLFMSKAGVPTYLNRHHGFGVPIQWTIGGGAGEYPYSGKPQWDNDPTKIFNVAEVSRVGATGPAASSQALARYVNPTSRQRFFRRVLPVSSNLVADSDAQNLAGYFATKYANPARRVRSLMFEPSSNSALWPFVLGVELGDTVRINHRTVSRGTFTQTLQVEKITHEVDAAAGTWRTTMEFSPWTQDWVLAAMHTTVKTSILAGVNSVSLNPLPDSATNPAEASLGVGTTIQLSPGTANSEVLTILSVASAPTPGATGYTSMTVTFTANTTKAHTAGDYACDPLPSGFTDPTTWDAYSVIDSVTLGY